MCILRQILSSYGFIKIFAARIRTDLSGSLAGFILALIHGLFRAMLRSPLNPNPDKPEPLNRQGEKVAKAC